MENSAKRSGSAARGPVGDADGARRRALRRRVSRGLHRQRLQTIV
jgi:hypothetical protein